MPKTILTFGDGTEVELDRDPTPEEIEEIAGELGLLSKVPTRPLAVPPMRAEARSVPEPTLLERGRDQILDPAIQGVVDVGQGLGQGAARLGNLVGLVPDAVLEKMNEYISEQQQGFHAAHDPRSLVGSGTRSLAGLAAGARLPMPKAPLGRIGASAGYGALPSMATPSESGAQTLSRGAAGAVLGAGFQGTAETIPALRRAMSLNMTRKLVANQDTRTIEEAFAQARTRPTLGQLTEDPTIQGEEASVMQQAPGRFLTQRNAQKKVVLENMQAEIDRFGGVKSQEQRGSGIRRVYTETVDRLVQHTHDQWRTTQAPLRHILGDQKTIRMDQTLSSLDELIERYDDPVNPANAGLANQLRSWKRKLSGPQAQTDPLTGRAAAENVYSLDQVTDMLGGLTAKLRKNDPKANHAIFNRLGDKSTERLVARQLINSLLDDVDGAATTMDPELGGLMRQARTEYRAGMDEVRAVQATVLGKFLDRPGGSAESAWRAFLDLDPSQMRHALKMAEDYSPEMVDTMRAGYLNDIIQSSMIGESRFLADAQFNVGQFMKGTQTEAFRQLFPQGGTRSTFAATLKVMNQIKLNPVQQIAKNIAEEIGSEIGVGTGLATGQWGSVLFAAKYWIRFGGPKAAAEIMADPRGPEAIKILNKIENPGWVRRNAAKAAWALGVIIAHTGETETKQAEVPAP